MKIKNLSFLILAIPLLANCAGANKDHFDIIRDNYKNYLIKSASFGRFKDMNASEIKNELYIVRLNNEITYRFRKIDYMADDDRANWPAGSHMSWTYQIGLRAYLEKNNELNDIATKLAAFWGHTNYRNVNWWQNEIGDARNVSNYLIFHSEDLSPKALAGLKGKIREASLYWRPSVSTHTGSNLINYAETTIKSAVIDKNEDELQTAVKRLEKEMTYGDEGFQEDGTFYQHGHLIQNGSYGLEGALNITRVLSNFKDTDVRIDSDRLKVLSNFILKGLRYLSHKGNYNYAGMGRAYTRAHGTLTTKSLNFSALGDLAKLTDMPDKEEINQFIKDCEENKSTFSGIYYFPTGKLLTMNIDGVYMSFKGTGVKITNTECVNNENILGQNLSYGTNTTIMDEGYEYTDITALWNYDYIPGTTSFTFGDDETLYSNVENVYDNNKYENFLPENKSDGTPYIYKGGTIDDVSYSINESKHEGISFTVTAIGCNDGLVILGSDIKHELYKKTKGTEIIPESVNAEKGGTFKLHTTLEQCIVKSEPKLVDNRTLERGNVIYKSLDNNIITLKYDKNRTGDVRRNNRPSASRIETADICTAYINHNSEGPVSYAYVIQPKSKINRIFTLIENDVINKGYQAIKLPNNKVAVAFFKDVTSGDYTGNRGDFKIY